VSANYHINGVPDDLPPGDYSTRILDIKIVPCRNGDIDLVFELDYVGPAKPKRTENGLFLFTKGEADANANRPT